MEKQYGERYIMKVEERLLHYLEELNKALPQPTYIDQVRPCVCRYVTVLIRKLFPIILCRIFCMYTVKIFTSLKQLIRRSHPFIKWINSLQIL